MRNQQGYFLLVAVVLVMVMGAMGVVTAYMVANRARMSVALQGGMSAFYVAESGLEIASRLLVGANLVSGQGVTCATLTGNSLLTNSSVLNGTFTATAVGGGLYTGSSTLSGGINATSNSLILASATGFAPHGRIRIDSEVIDYASLSGNTLTGLNRGMSGSVAASHSSGASVTQSMCLVSVTGGVPSVASPRYQRVLEMGVEISSASELWAVANRTGNRFQIMRYNNPTAGAWSDYTFTDNSNRKDLFAVSASSMTNAWAAGSERSNNFTFVRWNGSTWAAAPVSGACSGQDINGIAIMGDTQGWAVGQRYRPGCSGGGNYRYTIMRWNGTAWSLLTPSGSPSIPADASGLENLNGLSMFDSTNTGTASLGFAVGDSGTILRFNGTNWVTNSSGVTNDLYAAAVVSNSEAWAVGNNGVILKWNGSSWSSVSSPTTRRLNAITMVDSDNDGTANFGWAVGNNGTIIYFNGTSWANQASPVSTRLNGVVAISNTSAFIVGNSADLLEWDGTSWSQISSVLSGTMNGMGIYRGSSSTGTKVGSWQQTFG